MILTRKKGVDIAVQMAMVLSPGQTRWRLAARKSVAKMMTRTARKSSTAAAFRYVSALERVFAELVGMLLTDAVMARPTPMIATRLTRRNVFDVMVLNLEESFLALVSFLISMVCVVNR